MQHEFAIHSRLLIFNSRLQAVQYRFSIVSSIEIGIVEKQLFYYHHDYFYQIISKIVKLRN